MIRHFYILLFHELRMHLVKPATYVAGTLFLGIVGLIYWIALWEAAREGQDWLPSEDLFRLYWAPALVFVPMLTMGTFAEERRLGTLASLLTTPVGAHVVVFAKFAAAYVLYMAFWLIALGFPFIADASLHGAAGDPRLLGGTALVGGILFIAFSSPLQIALGIFFSSLTRSVQVAGIITCVSMILLIALNKGLYWMADSYLSMRWLYEPAELLNAAKYAEDFVRGVVDTRPLLHFGSGAILALGATALVVESKA